ncbi:MAG: hypothetical protein K2P81_02865 [Bacteriovoracaceae bacterium]|nr:hypothetical protein [Bacteriovoracaceae bacterium]
MKSIITLILAFAFLGTATASTGATVGLKQAISELNYTLNVEWNQKDPAFHQAAINKFREQLQILKAQGLSNKEMIQATLAEVKDAGLKAELAQAYAIIDAQKLDSDAAQNVIVDIANRSRSEGASWVGGASIFQWIGIAIAVALVLGAFSGSSGPACTENCPQSSYQCGYQNVCGWNYDAWGYYGYNCGFNYVCGWYYW